MGEKKLVPKKRFREHKHDSEWSYFNWKDTVDISKNMVDPRNEEYSDLPHIGPGNIKSFTGLLLNNINTVKEDNLISGKFHFNTGDIVYGKINPQLGKYTYALYEGLASADTYILNSKNGLEQRFLFMLLQTKHFFNYSVSVSKRSGMPKINRDELNEYTFCAPTKEEQQKIGEFFKVLDERIANQERKIAKVKALKAAYLTEMFPQEGETVPKRRFKGFEGEWKVIDLDSIGSTFSGLSGKTIKDFGHGTAEFVTYMNVFNNTLADLNNTEKVIYDNKETQLKYGDILFTTSSETPDEVGMSSVWLSDRPNVYLNSFCFGFRSNIKIDYYFIGYLLRANEFRRKVEVLAQGISRYNISKSRVMKLKINLPSIKEQQKIGQFFKNIDDQIEMEEKKLDKLQKMKEAYLEEMFV